MAVKINWYPTSRTAQLVMGKNWGGILTTKGKDWNVPDAETQALGVVVGEADSVLAAAESDVTRTPVVTARCREVFDRMKARMQDIKKRYFYAPPLTEADFVALGIKIPDSTYSPTRTPTAQVTVETFLVGRHELGIRIVYVTGSPEDRENKSYRVYYIVVGPGELPPAKPSETWQSFSTKRRKDLVEFEYGDSGKTVYFAVQIENDGKKGPWGPMVSALIP
jgi:hypothetical protein